MQTPTLNNTTAVFLKAGRRAKRLSTCSASRHSYKPSSLLIDVQAKGKRKSDFKFKTIYEKTDEERRTRKKVYCNPVSYFRTLLPDMSVNGLEDVLYKELFGVPPKSSILLNSKLEIDESMEIVHLKNSSIHMSKIFNSNLLDATPHKIKQSTEKLLYKENESRVNSGTSTILSLIEQLDKTINTTDLDNVTRYRLQESVDSMRKTLQGQRVQISRSFSKYLSNKRPTLLYRN